MSKAIIYIMNEKKSCVFAGSCMSNNGMNKMICCVSTIPIKYCKPIDKKMLTIAFPAMINVVESAISAPDSSMIFSAIPFKRNYEGIYFVI